MGIFNHHLSGDGFFMNLQQEKNYLSLAIQAAMKASTAVLEFYNSTYKIETKIDNSPVTEADKASSKIICEMLAPTGIYVISEEEYCLPYKVRKEFECIWSIDPIDGTKEFIKKNGEFTINVALIKNQQPYIGVILSPVNGTLYFASKNIGAYKGNILNMANTIELKDIIAQSEKLGMHCSTDNYTVIVSRSHLSKETYSHIEELKQKHGELTYTYSGSSIKMCLVAEGSANEYPRYGTTCEWDTASGHAILNATGKDIYDVHTNLPLKYNKEDLKNPWFIAK
jgi:3'(2'), 5'-bisphosphate nucleotidase